MRTNKTNQQIRSNNIYLIEDNKGTTLMDLQTAMSMAAAAELDLVEVSLRDGIPVCKILDYGKYKYQMHKKQMENKKHQPKNTLKEIRLSPRIEKHDIEVKLNQVRRFLDENFKVQVSVKFKGRENEHREIGLRILESFKIEGITVTPPKAEGNQIYITLMKAT